MKKKNWYFLKITNKLKDLGFDNDKIISAYDETHRYYHNWNHILKMLNDAEEKNILTDDLFLAIVFHDVVYDPKRNDNEEKSANLFWNSSNESIDVASFRKYNKQAIFKAIKQTKTHERTGNDLGGQLVSLDLAVFRESIEEQIAFEKAIFKEYQFVDWKTYKEKRLQVLEKLEATEEHKNYLRFYEPKIAVFAGSFNPFHVGHLNILEKAEKIFDKVIIASGLNPEKTAEKQALPLSIQNRQIEYYDGLLTDFLKGLDYPVTLVRGLRDANDLLYESNQICFLKELMPNLNIIEILCDKEYNHISSSAIRSLQKYNVADKYLLK